MIISKVQLVWAIVALVAPLVVGVGYVGWAVADLRGAVVVCGDLEAWLLHLDRG